VREIFPLKNFYPADGEDNGGDGLAVNNLTLSWEYGGDPAVTGYFLYIDQEKARVESSTATATSQAEYAVSLPFNAIGTYIPMPPLLTDKTYY